MASFFKKPSDKDKKEQAGQPSAEEGSAGMSSQSPPPPPPPKKKSGFFAKKGSGSPKKEKPPKEPKPPRVKKEKAPREKKEKPPKEPKPPRVNKEKAPREKKPMFSFGKKKKKEKEAPPAGAPAVTEPSATPPAGAPEAPAAGATVTSEPPAAAATEKKGFFANKGDKKQKAPKEKKARAPREKKQRAPREKKPRGEKKPMFSFGKKKEKVAPGEELAPGEPGAAGAPVAEPGAPIGVPPEAGPQKKGRAARKGKKVREPRKPRKPKKPREPRKRGKKAAAAGKTATKKKSKRGGVGKQSPVGLDLGSSTMTAVRLKYQTGGSQLQQVAIDSLPTGLIQDGEVRDIGGLTFAIKEFWKTHKIKGKKVALGLANQKVIVRTLDFPLLDEKELRSAIEFQAQDYIPIPVEDAVFDFHVLGTFSDDDGVEKQKVLVVAAQKDMVMDFINAVKNAKLTISGIDLQAFAMLRGLAPTSFLDTAPPSTATAIANIASDITNLVVDAGGEPQFTRIISFGGDDFTKAVEDMQGITFAEAEELKARAGLPEPGQRSEAEPGEPEAGPGAGPPQPPGGPEAGEAPTGIIRPEGTGPQAGGIGPEAEGPGPVRPEMPAGPPEKEPASEEPPQGPPPAGAEPAGEGENEGWGQGKPTEAETPEENMANIQRVLEATADSLADEIRRSLDYYMSQEHSVPVGRLLISGGGAMLKNLDAHLSQIFPFSVEVGNPLLRIAENKSDLSDDVLQAIAPRLTISIGLALEDEG